MMSQTATFTYLEQKKVEPIVPQSNFNFGQIYGSVIRRVCAILNLFSLKTLIFVFIFF